MLLPCLNYHPYISVNIMETCVSISKLTCIPLPTLQAFPREMEAGRSVVHGDKIYFAACESKQICYYSVSTGEWADLGTPMEYINPGLAIIRGCVATIGGKKDDKPTNEVSLWKDQDWKKLEKKMKHCKSDPAVVTGADEKYIIVISGKSHTSFAVPWTSDIEIYDVNENEWKQLCPLPSPFQRIEVTLFEGMVYVFPDEYPKAFKCCLKALVASTKDEKEDIWKTIAGLPLRYSTPATLGSKVICVGGAGMSKYGRRDIYEYNEQKDSWVKIGNVEGVGRMYSMVEVCEDRCVVVGGICELADEHERLNTVNIFTRESLASKER